MERWDIHDGDDVYGIDGEKIGAVTAVQPGYVVVERGRFFPTTFYVPAEAVATRGDGVVHLAVTKETALNMSWESEPPISAAPLAADAAGRVGTEPFAHDARPDAVAHDHGEDRILVPLHAEDLTAATRPRRIGEVRLEKQIVTEERTIEVPVTEERLRVTRHPVDRPVAAGEAGPEEAVIEVPIRGEEVLLGTKVRVAEEVELGKEAVRRTGPATATVRREEIRIAEEAVPDASPARETESER